MSTSGLGSLATIIIHGLFILISLTLLVYTFVKTGKTKILLGVTFAIVTSIYAFWFATKDNWKENIAKKYVGNYTLTNYKDCIDCVIEIRKDNSYRVFDKNKDYENGTWKYFDDGDISFVEFNNGGQLGFNEYQYGQ